VADASARAARTVTKLEAQKNNRARVSVYLDGEYAFGLAAEVAARLQVGQALAEPDAERLRVADDVHRARELALRFLSYRPRSRREVSDYLRGKHFDGPVVESVMARLAGLGLVDDDAFADWWVENRSQHRPRSRRALRTELARKGVPGDVVDAALEGIDDLAAAVSVARKHAARLASLERPEFESRMTTFLQRRGFDFEVIRGVVANLRDEVQNDR
jgi:regulatory protein